MCAPRKGQGGSRDPLDFDIKFFVIFQLKSQTYELKLLSVFDSMILMNVVLVCYFVYILQVIVVLNYTKYQI